MAPASCAKNKAMVDEKMINTMPNLQFGKYYSILPNILSRYSLTQVCLGNKVITATSYCDVNVHPC